MITTSKLSTNKTQCNDKWFEEVDYNVHHLVLSVDNFFFFVCLSLAILCKRFAESWYNCSLIPEQKSSLTFHPCHLAYHFLFMQSLNINFKHNSPAPLKYRDSCHRFHTLRWNEFRSIDTIKQVYRPSVSTPLPSNFVLFLFVRF